MADITESGATLGAGDGARSAQRAEALKAKAEAVRDWAEERADQARSWASDGAGGVRMGQRHLPSGGAVRRSAATAARLGLPDREGAAVAADSRRHAAPAGSPAPARRRAG